MEKGYVRVYTGDGQGKTTAAFGFADLVTEMREVKHYYNAGVLSRDGYDH